MPFARLRPRLAAVLGIAAYRCCSATGSSTGPRKRPACSSASSRPSQQPPIHLGAAQVNPADVVYFHVEASGEFKPDGTVYVDNRVRDGVRGL